MIVLCGKATICLFVKVQEHFDSAVVFCNLSVTTVPSKRVPNVPNVLYILRLYTMSGS